MAIRHGQVVGQAERVPSVQQREFIVVKRRRIVAAGLANYHPRNPPAHSSAPLPARHPRLLLPGFPVCRRAYSPQNMKDKDIEFLDVVALRGPNIWTYRPVLEAWVDIGAQIGRAHV